MSGLKIDFILETFQENVPHNPKMSAKESLLVTREVESVLKKEAIQNPYVKKGQLLSSLFLLGKTYRGNRPVINLKILKAYIPYLPFKMEGLHLLNDMLKEKDYKCKRPKGCSLSCSTASKTSKVHPVLLEGQSYKFLCYVYVFVFRQGTNSIFEIQFMK